MLPIVSLSRCTKLQGGFFPEGFVGRINRNTNYDKLADGYEVRDCKRQNPTAVAHCCKYACCSVDCQWVLQKLLLHHPSDPSGGILQEFPFPATVAIAVRTCNSLT